MWTEPSQNTMLKPATCGLPHMLVSYCFVVGSALDDGMSRCGGIGDGVEGLGGGAAEIVDAGGSIQIVVPARPEPVVVALIVASEVLVGEQELLADHVFVGCAAGNLADGYVL